MISFIVRTLKRYNSSLETFLNFLLLLLFFILIQSSILRIKVCMQFHLLALIIILYTKKNCNFYMTKKISIQKLSLCYEYSIVSNLCVIVHGKSGMDKSLLMLLIYLCIVSLLIYELQCAVKAQICMYIVYCILYNIQCTI